VTYSPSGAGLFICSCGGWHVCIVAGVFVYL
jgi:hypothetical protein